MRDKDYTPPKKVATIASLEIPFEEAEVNPHHGEERPYRILSRTIIRAEVLFLLLAVRDKAKTVAAKLRIW